MEQVILVNKNNEEIGSEEKIEAHKKCLLHRALSIFVFNSKGQLMIQKRNKNKYHSGGLWTNTCCSHPRPGESIEDAVHRRLKFEMGFDCHLKEAFSFIYKKEFVNLCEYEFDHVFIGNFDDDPVLNKDEVEDWKWIDIKELKKDIAENPENYSFWFKKIINKVLHVYFK